MIIFDFIVQAEALSRFYLPKTFSRSISQNLLTQYLFNDVHTNNTFLINLIFTFISKTIFPLISQAQHSICEHSKNSILVNKNKICH